MKRRLREGEVRRVELILSILVRRRPELIPLLEVLTRRDLSMEEREALRDVIVDELVELGLDEDDEPTRYGLVLEELIDWLGRRSEES